MITTCKKCGKIISDRFPMHLCIYVGQHIYYITRDRDSIPAKILKVKKELTGVKKVFISETSLTRKKSGWVSVKNIEFQD